MRLQEWQFLEEHPIYEREWQETRWPAALPGMRPRAYLPYVPPGRTMPMAGVREPLLMEMVGHPSVDIHQAASGNTVQTVHLQSIYAPYIRLDRMRDFARRWVEALRRLSRGPYSQKDLREMGHPYGFGVPGSKASWVRLGTPRVIPSFPVGTRRGARAAVPNRAVINLQSGDFESHWRWSVLRWGEGITLNFWNEAKSKEGAPYPWFLSHGTVKMQAHGPWPYVAEELLPQVQNDWRQGAAEAARALAAAEGQFGEEPVAKTEQDFEAGGFM